MAGSVLCAVVSVTGGFVPYLAVYEILRLFIEGEAEVKGIAVWSGIAMAGYLVKICLLRDLHGAFPRIGLYDLRGGCGCRSRTG